MIAKDNYSFTSPMNEGATSGNYENQYFSNIPFRNVPILQLNMEIPPIERMQIVPDVPNLANMDTFNQSLPKNTPSISQSEDMSLEPINGSTISLKKPNYLVYGGGALVVVLATYMLLKKN